MRHPDPQRNPEVSLLRSRSPAVRRPNARPGQTIHARSPQPRLALFRQPRFRPRRRRRCSRPESPRPAGGRYRPPAQPRYDSLPVGRGAGRRSGKSVWPAARAVDRESVRVPLAPCSSPFAPVARRAPRPATALLQLSRPSPPLPDRPRPQARLAHEKAPGSEPASCSGFSRYPWRSSRRPVPATTTRRVTSPEQHRASQLPGGAAPPHPPDVLRPRMTMPTESARTRPAHGP